MQHFCTYFDRHYLTRGLALHRSLREHCREPFTLWILCFDDETYGALSQMALPSVRLIRQDEFEKDDGQLCQAKANRSRVEYFWTCTPSLPLYVFSQDPNVTTVTYLDADLYFYSDLTPIFDEFGHGSILIIPHRFPTGYVNHADAAGIYNVQFMTFRRDANGLACLTWWRERCLEWCSTRSEDGKYGDQKYLDDWPDRFRGVVVLRHKGAGLAPWNMIGYRVCGGDGRVMVDDVPLIFHHFHGLRFGRVLAVAPPKMYRYEAGAILRVYLPYAMALSTAARTLETLFPGLLPGKPNLSMNSFVACLWWKGCILLKYKWLRRWLWLKEESFLKSEALLDRGYLLFQQGRWREARKALFHLVVRNPFYLKRPGVAAIIAKTLIK